MVEVAALIAGAVKATDPSTSIEIGKKVNQLVAKYPAYKRA
jgi:glycine/serine hydroxymethyltransferase